MSIGTTKIILNPEFDPEAYNKWVYRDLQLLAKNLGVKASGKKVCIVRRLKQWHKTHFKEAEILMDSLVLSANKEMNVQPSLLSPLKSKPRRKHDGTPISIKKNRTDSKKNKKNKKKKRLSFSVFNGMNIIPARNREEELPSPPWSIRQLHKSGAIEDYYNGIDDPEEIALMNEENNQEYYNEQYESSQDRHDEYYDDQEGEKQQQWVKLPNGKWILKEEDERREEEGRQEKEGEEVENRQDEYEKKSRQENGYSEEEKDMQEVEEVTADVEEEEEEEEEEMQVQRNLNEELLDSVVYDNLMQKITEHTLDDNCVTSASESTKITGHTLDDNCVTSATESTKITGKENNVLQEKTNNAIKNPNMLKNNPFEYHSNGISVPVTLPKLKDAHPKLKDVHERLAQDLARLMTDIDAMADKENWKRSGAQIANTKHDIKLLNSPIKITPDLQQRQVLQERSCNELSCNEFSDYICSEDDLEYSQV